MATARTDALTWDTLQVIETQAQDGYNRGQGLTISLCVVEDTQEIKTAQRHSEAQSPVNIL